MATTSSGGCAWHQAVKPTKSTNRTATSSNRRGCTRPVVLSSAYAGSSGGSKITYTVGRAVQKAAEAAREKLLAVASEELEIAPDDLEIADGVVRPIGAPVQQVSLLGGIVDDYTRVSRGDLPGRARDLSAVRAAVSFPIEPLRAPDLRLLGAWTTDVRGEPAAVLAYRLRDRLVVQYLVAEDAFFRHPAVRTAVADRHLLTAADGARALVAWPGTSTGTVLVGDVPSEWLQSIWRSERAH